MFNPISLQPRLPDHPKHQLRIELLPSPRGHSSLVEVVCNLPAVQPVLMKPQDAVYERLMGRVKVDKGQCFGFNPNSNTKVCGRLDFGPEKGQKEIIPP
jgi:hypothetical protein